MHSSDICRGIKQISGAEGFPWGYVESFGESDEDYLT